MSNIFQSVAGVFSTFLSYLPTYGGGLASSSTISYLRIGKTIILFPFVSGTVTGTPSGVTFTLPSGVTAAEASGGLLWVDNAGGSRPVACPYIVPLNSGTVTIAQGDNGAFVAGAAAVNGFMVIHTN